MKHAPRIVGVLIGLVLLVAGVALAVRPVGDQQLRHGLSSVVEGTVVKAVLDEHTDYLLLIEWQDAAERKHQLRVRTDTSPWVVGEPVDVRFDPQNPAKAVLDDPSLTRNGYFRSNAIAEGIACGILGLVITLTAVVAGRAAEAYGSSPALTWTDPAPGRAAIREPRTERAWSSYGRRTLMLLAAAVLAGVVGLSFYLPAHDRAVSLATHGVPTEATVVRGSSDGGKWTQAYVTVEYRDEKGHLHGGRLRGYSPDGLGLPGTQIDILYDRHAPDDFRTIDEVNNSDLVDNGQWIPFTVSGLLLLSALLFAPRYALGRGVLVSAPWRRLGVLDVKEAPRLGWVRLVLSGPEGPVALRALLANQGISTLNVRPGGSVDVCAHPNRTTVMVRPDDDRPYLCRLPRTVRQRDAGWEGNQVDLNRT